MGHRRAAFQIASTRSEPPSWGYSTSTRDRVGREGHVVPEFVPFCLLESKYAACGLQRTPDRRTTAASGRLELIEEVA